MFVRVWDVCVNVICVFVRVCAGVCDGCKALDAFSNAVKINQDYAEAYHQRGLCRMRLQQSKSVQDFNRALSINPNLFQVSLGYRPTTGIKGQ